MPLINIINQNDILKNISKELCVKGNVYDIIEVYLNYKNKHYQKYKKEYENQFNDYRDENIEEKENYIIENLSNRILHKILRQIELIHLLWDFDAVSLYPSAMRDKNSIYPRIERGFAFTSDMNDELNKKINKINFTQGSAILKIKYFNPKNLIVNHLPVKEREKIIEIIRIGTGIL